MAAANHILFRDFETRSGARLDLVGAWRYAADPSTEVLCVGYAVDDGPVRIWTPGQAIPEEFIDAARNSDWLVIAHNDQFESAIEQLVLAPRYAWSLVPLERHRCTMAMAMAAALPGALEGAALALGLSYQKDREGRRLMLRLSRASDQEPGAEGLERLFGTADGRHNRTRALSPATAAQCQRTSTMDTRRSHQSTRLPYRSCLGRGGASTRAQGTGRYQHNHRLSHRRHHHHRQPGGEDSEVRAGARPRA